MGYHPEKAIDEISHFRATLPEAQEAVDAVAKDFGQHLNEVARTMNPANKPSDVDAQKQRRIDAVGKAQKLIADAAEQSGKQPVKSAPAQAGK